MMEILLVDDESYVTESLARTIPWEEMGVRKVYQAASAFEALDILEEQDIDIVVTDIRMPEMTGLELIGKVAEKWPHIRCILLTGYSDFEYAKQAVQLQAFDYILKPVNDEEFVKSVSGAMESLKDEWERFDKYHRLQYSRKSDYSVLRAHLMHDLLLGRQLSDKTIRNKLAEYEISFRTEVPAVMMLIQPGRYFSGMDHHSVSLMEFAIGNIAEELFSDEFYVWTCKAPHDCLVLLAELKEETLGRCELDRDYDQLRRQKLEAAVQAFRKNVSYYLKGSISILITEWFPFPQGVPAAYRAGLSAMYLSLSGHEEADSVLFLEDRPLRSEAPVKSLESLYKPPTLIHLLESKQWEAARQRIEDVLADMEKTRCPREHLHEFFLFVTNAFMYTAHKHGLFIYSIDQSGLDPLLAHSIMQSFEKLKDWSFRMLEKLKQELAESDRYAKSHLIKQVQELVANGCGQELSVKTIAERVYLHPVYLSKIYKAETGEGLGDYIIRMRMERALYLLKNTNKKIYEITAELGYQNPQYFSKMFKKHYGMTPNEFREQ